MLLRVFWMCLAIACFSFEGRADGLPDGRYLPRRPGEPPSYQRYQQQGSSSQRQYARPQPAPQANQYAPTVRPQPTVRSYSQAPRQQVQASPSGTVPRSQRFAPTRPGAKRGAFAPKEKISTRSVRAAYSLYKGYHSIQQATAKAQARTVEGVFVEAVEDTTSPPTMAKIITYPIKLVANVVVEVVRTVAVDWWKY